VREDVLWQVRWHEDGRVKRKFFTARADADSHAALMRGDTVNTRKALATLPQSAQDRLWLIHDESDRRGVDLANLLTLLSSAKDAPTTSPALETVIAEMISVKRRAGLNERYLTDLQQIMNMFAKGRERMAIDKIGLVEVEKFLDSKKLASRSTLRARLSTLFNFSVRRGYTVADPCLRLESVTVKKTPPAIFTVEQVQKCLAWLRQNPRALGWFVLSTFAGLRPEEAEKTTWRDIHFTEGWIRVEAQTTKTGQRRIVSPQPMVLEWLKLAKKLGAMLPISKKQATDERIKLRTLLGWDEWKQDVTRHSASSYWLALTGEAAQIATQLGHSEKTMRKHYMAVSTEDGKPLTKVVAERFWAIKV